MRRELEILAQIDDFLDGKISKEKLFDNLKDVQNLQEHINIQKGLRHAIQKEAFIQNSKNNLSKFKLVKTLKIVLMAIGLPLVMLLAITLINRQESNTLPTNTSNKSGEAIHSISDSLITTQYFYINNQRDTLVITKNGMIISIAKNAFATGESSIYQLQIKEAISPSAIIKGGLSTTADDDLLETGGMFKISAFQNAAKIYLKAAKSIDFFVPTVNPIPGMQAYRGEITQNGEINWTKPKPLTNTLTPGRMERLNFYPPKYLDYIKKNGLSKKKKSWTDSVYFDLSNMNTKDKMVKKGDSLFNYKIQKAIDPQLIKAFWNNNFNYTLLATREFESRMPLIHEVGKAEILNLYTENLNKNLYEIDSMAIELAPKAYKDEFRNWYCYKQGRAPKNQSVQSLVKLEQLLKTNQQQIGNIQSSKKVMYYRGKLITEDLFYYYNIDIPLAERKKRIANDKKRYERLTHNLANDKALGAQIKSSHTPQIRQEVNITVENAQQFKRKRCFAYLLRKDAYSFEKIKVRNGKLNIQHQNLENYLLAIVGLKNNETWLFIVDELKNANVKLRLETQEKFDEKINKIASSNRFKNSINQQIAKATKAKKGSKASNIKSRLQIALVIYDYSIDTILNENDINIYEKNKFTIQTMDYDWISRRVPAIPTKLSHEINFIKGFLNTQEYTVSNLTKDKFRVELLNEAGTDVLKNQFYLASKKTDQDGRQQNISFGWALQNDKQLKKGKYTANLYYGDRLISTKQIVVLQ